MSLVIEFAVIQATVEGLAHAINGIVGLTEGQLLQTWCKEAMKWSAAEYWALHLAQVHL